MQVLPKKVTTFEDSIAYNDRDFEELKQYSHDTVVPVVNPRGTKLGETTVGRILRDSKKLKVNYGGNEYVMVSNFNRR